jgi:hypothetical protein
VLLRDEGVAGREIAQRLDPAFEAVFLAHVHPRRARAVAPRSPVAEPHQLTVSCTAAKADRLRCSDSRLSSSSARRSGLSPS